MPLDVPTQVQWHMRGTIRNEGTREQVQYAMDISKMVIDTAEVQLKHGIPGMEVVDKDQLFR